MLPRTIAGGCPSILQAVATTGFILLNDDAHHFPRTLIHLLRVAVAIDIEIDEPDPTWRFEGIGAVLDVMQLMLRRH